MLAWEVTTKRIHKETCDVMSEACLEPTGRAEYRAGFVWVIQFGVGNGKGEVSWLTMIATRTRKWPGWPE